MSKTDFDMGLIVLQLIAVCGGLILIGCLSVRIFRNRRQPGRPDASFSETLVSQLVEQQFQKALVRVPATRNNNRRRPAGTLRSESDRGTKPSAEPARLLKKRTSPGSEGRSPLSTRYQQAAHLAARGVEPGIIQRRVELPRCEIDLIAKLSCQLAPFNRGTHQNLLEAIEAGG